MQITSLTSRYALQQRGVRVTDFHNPADGRETEAKRLARQPAIQMAGMLAGMTDEAGKEKLAGLVKDLVLADKLSRDLAANAKAVRKEDREAKLKELQARLKALQQQVTMARLQGNKQMLKGVAAEASQLAREIKAMIRDAGGAVTVTMAAEGGGMAGIVVETDDDVDPEAFAREVVGLPAEDAAAVQGAEAEAAAGQQSEPAVDDLEWRRALEVTLAVARMIHRQARNALPQKDRDQIPMDAGRVDVRA
jgi:hypothetical protein